MYAKLAVIRHDLSVIKELGATFVILETDSLDTDHLISKGDATSHDNTGCCITHALREANYSVLNYL